MAKNREISFMDRLILQALGKGQTVGNEDDPAKEAFPALWEWLSRIYVGEDKIKQPPSLTVTLSPDGVVVRVSDRDLARAVEVTCANLQDCFSALEINLNSPKPAIKILGKREPNLRKRKKD